MSQESGKTVTRPPENAVQAPARSRTLLIVVPVFLLFALFSYVGFRWMHEDALATLVEFSGQPERDTAREMHAWRKAQEGDEFHAGDGARTGVSSDAHFRLVGGAVLKLKPASQIRFQRPGKRGALRVDVDVGEANVQSGSVAMTIESEFGEIVLDPKSAVRMNRTGTSLAVDVEWGRIELSGKEVAAGEGVELELGGIIVDVPLTEPAKSAPEERLVEPEAEPEVELNLGDGIAGADLVVAAGETFVVHDPNPPTAIGFRVDKVCDGPARLTSGTQATEARGQANLRFATGQHNYEVHCLDRPKVVAARGTFRVLRDAGTRKLPTFTPTANVTTDGRLYTVMYQHRLPKVTVSWPTAPAADSYTLRIGGRTIRTKAPRHTFSSLPRGTHSVSFTAATTPVRSSRVTKVEVVYDTQAPAARVSEPPLGFEPGEEVTISGQAMPGWNVSVGEQKLEVDAQHKFSVELEGRDSIPITFSHPSRGTHHYLRRPKASP